MDFPVSAGAIVVIAISGVGSWLSVVCVSATGDFAGKVWGIGGGAFSVLLLQLELQKMKMGHKMPRYLPDNVLCMGYVLGAVALCLLR